MATMTSKLDALVAATVPPGVAQEWRRNWRPDHRCGTSFPDDAGRPSRCAFPEELEALPDKDLYLRTEGRSKVCCSAEGWCSDACDCEGCSPPPVTPDLRFCTGTPRSIDLKPYAQPSEDECARRISEAREKHAGC